MAKTKSNANARSFVALFATAKAQCEQISQSYGNASGAILTAVLAAKAEGATPAEFESCLAPIAALATGIVTVTINGYVSNARRIFACPADKFAEAQKAGGNSLQLMAKACPAVHKAKAEAKTKASAEKKAAEPKAAEPSPVKVSTPATDPLLALQNDLLACRKMFGNKRAVLTLIGEMEDMLGELKKLAA